jgi:hypothetical protein
MNAPHNEFGMNVLEELGDCGTTPSQSVGDLRKELGLRRMKARFEERTVHNEAIARPNKVKPAAG